MEVSQILRKGVKEWRDVVEWINSPVLQGEKLWRPASRLWECV